MKHRLFIAAALLMAAAAISAQNKSAGIQLSLWKKVSTQPADSLQTTYFNFGLQSTLNRLNGVGCNLVAGVVRKEMNGLQLAAISNMVGQSMRGVQLSGITNINGNNLAGLSAAGLVSIVGNNTRGVLFAGMTNIAGDNSCGVLLSGLTNVTGNKASGLQLAGLSNIAGSSVGGVMAAGMLNVAGSHIHGIQLSGVGNVAGGQADGAQIGLANYATRVKGVQIGLVNYYKEEMKGFQLGLVNANPNTKVQWMLFGGNATKLNIAARFKNQLFYTIVGGGTHYFDFSDKFSASLFYRGGMWFPLWKQFSVSGDLGYQHIETFKNKECGAPARLFALQARINLEMQLGKKLALFATGGYGGSRLYNRSMTYDKGVIIEAGIVVFGMK